MLDLKINNLPVVLKGNTNFTLNRENPFFTNAGDFTFEVALPLEGCLENQKVFGVINRMEISVAHFVGKKYPFALVAPPLSIEGNAIITNIDDKEVKVQLLGGASGFNIDMLDGIGEDIYIDELDLGKAYEDVYPEAYANGDRYFEEGLRHVTSPREYLMTKLHSEKNDKVLFGNHGETSCVNFPIYSIADEAKANDKALFELHADQKVTMKYRFPSFKPAFAYFEENKYLLAAQPYLIDIVTAVIKQLGYTIPNGKNDVLGTWMENIFIANGKSEYKFNRILPHWTVAEFFKEVRQFFGVFFQVKDKSLSIVKKSDFYKNTQNYIPINEVVDEYTVQLNNDEEAKDVSDSNVEYGQPSLDDMLRLPDEVWQNAIIKKYPNEQIMIAGESSVSEAQRAMSPFVLVNEGEKKVYAYLQSKAPAGNGAFYRVQVDCCPPLIRHGEQFGPGHRDADITLKIVPAVMRWINVNFARQEDIGGRYPEEKVYENAIAMPMICSSFSRDNNLDHYSVDAAINPDAAQTNEEKDVDIIEVAYNAGVKVDTFGNYNLFENRWQAIFSTDGNRKQRYLPIALGIAYVIQEDGFYMPVICPSNNDHFNMLHTLGDCINTAALSQGFKIDTRCKHIISFLDNVDLDPTSVFLIRGKKYACEKIEMVIDERGVKNIKKGTFYEIN